MSFVNDKNSKKGDVFKKKTNQMLFLQSVKLLKIKKQKTDG
jgi:hypothetical protein